jgi:DNA-binding NtrC family response regulator
MASRATHGDPLARILLVDDEEIVLRLFETVLELDHHDVTTAGNGNGALAAIAKEPFDLVITDLVMPDKEGIETIVEILKLRPNLPIIAMSGGGRGNAADYLDMAAKLGARKTLAKPFSTQALLDAVNEVLRP